MQCQKTSIENSTKLSEIKLLIFDLDGVLIDSKENMRYSWSYVKKKYGLKFKFDNFFNNIGLKFEDILNKLNIKNYQTSLQKAYSRASIYYFYKIKLYKGVKNIINYLRKNYYIAVLTSKDNLRTKKILKKFNLKFHYIYCPVKGKKGKPNPWQINNLLKKLKLKKKNAVYIGDTSHDKKTASNAKVKFIYAKYGYGNLKNEKYFINKPKDLFKYI